MKYTCEILINLPRARVLELFDSSENLKKWQPGLLSLTHLDGKPGEEGARSELVYEGRKGDLVMIETILNNFIWLIKHAAFTTPLKTGSWKRSRESPCGEV